jgi:preprotein translocase subunit SecA
MDYYDSLLASLRKLNPGTKLFINRLLNRDRYAFMEQMISLLHKINELEEKIKKFSNEEMKNKTLEFKDRLSKGETLEDILPEAYALVRESARRFVNMRHFDVQILGGIALHYGNIAEMSTGEGKTLVATLPVYLNALTGQGCHLVTVNDYLAKRDTQWMGPIYYNLGLSVGCIVSYFQTSGQSEMSAFTFDPAFLPADSRYLYLRTIPRKEAYACDITYGVGSEFGFDYLRDNMAITKESIVQRDLNYAIVDEVDSILIDEARTPLIISGPSEESVNLYYDIDKVVRKLNKDMDYILDEENQIVSLTDDGLKKCERFLGVENLYDGAHTDMVHLINQSLRAHTYSVRDKDYVVKNGEVIIVDEFTGRLMPGRRWSDGLHQAIEAKESVRIESENQTLATISFQNYFRLYKKLAGMTGTALTESAEFKEIYKLNVIAIPTNKPLKRIEFNDEIYKTEKEKFNSAVNEIEQMYKNSRPVLVGTVSIEKAEKLSKILRHKNIPHQVLHGKNHEAEAAIIAQAGKPGAVTIATQMAGRGVDIILGGNPEVLSREETIRIIWSQKSKIKSSSKTHPQKKLFHEVLNELEEAYKKSLEDIDKKYKSSIEQAKDSLTEKEKIFAQIDTKIKEQLERTIFIAKAEEEFLRTEPKILILKERYMETENALKNAQSQNEYQKKPELLKDFKESRSKAYHEYEGTKEFIRKKHGIFIRKDIEERANQIILLCEIAQGQASNVKKELEQLIENLFVSIKGYQDSITSVLSDEMKNSASFKDFSGRTKKIKDFLEISEKQVFELKIEQNEEFIKNFLDKFQAEYKNFISGLDTLESDIIFILGDKEYSTKQKEYLSASENYENLHSQYEKEISFAREEYEKKHSAIEEEWKTAREEMEKSPEEFRAIYNETLEKNLKPWEKDHEKVISLGGLHIIGTERHEARRVDNQLRGRAGRQGDPGSASFYLSLEDDLLRIFGSERLTGIMGKLPEGEKITHPIITKQITMAQKRVEGRNFEIRKHLIDFDDVLNQQRKVIYQLRRDILETQDIEHYLFPFINETIDDLFNEFLKESSKIEEWHPEKLSKQLKNIFDTDINLSIPENIKEQIFWRDTTLEDTRKKINEEFLQKKQHLGPSFNEIIKYIFLQEVDQKWKSHLRAIDDLREGINLRSYAQRDILVAYKQEAFLLFEQMYSSIKTEILSTIFKIKVEPSEQIYSPKKVLAPSMFTHQEFEQFETLQTQETDQQPSESFSVKTTGNIIETQPIKVGQKIGRNQPCPCGSGKKYKHCCGKNVTV